MPFIDLNDHPEIELAPGARARTPYGERVMLSRLELDEGSVVPLHQHPHEQAGMLLEGEMELTIGDETRLCRPGDMFIIPGGVLHRARTVKGPALVLDIFSPPREDYVELANRYIPKSD